MPAPSYPNRVTLLRQRLLTAPSTPPQPLLWDGQPLEAPDPGGGEPVRLHLRVPTLRDQANVFERAGVKPTEEAAFGMMSELAVQAAIALACDENGVALLDATAADQVWASEPTHWLYRLAMAAREVVLGGLAGASPKAHGGAAAGASATPSQPS